MCDIELTLLNSRRSSLNSSTTSATTHSTLSYRLTLKSNQGNINNTNFIGLFFPTILIRLNDFFFCEKRFRCDCGHFRFAEIYDAELIIHAKFSGLRYFMFYYPLTSAVIGSSLNLAILSLVVALSWFRYSLTFMRIYVLT